MSIILINIYTYQDKYIYIHTQIEQITNNNIDNSIIQPNIIIVSSLCVIQYNTYIHTYIYIQYINKRKMSTTTTTTTTTDTASTTKNTKPAFNIPAGGSSSKNHTIYYPYHRNEGYPKQMMANFRLVKVASLKRYIRYYNVQVRPDSTPVELASAVAKHFKRDLDVSGSVAGEKKVIEHFVEQVTREQRGHGLGGDHDPSVNDVSSKKRKRTGETAPWIVPDGDIQPGAEVAAKVGNEWIHARIVRYITRTKKYEVEDADAESQDKGKCYHVHTKYVLPLIIPKLSAELIKGERVLALFPYTTSFYEGQIVSTEAHDRYGVRFDDDVEDGKLVKKRKIPRYFVVPFPQHLQKDKKAK